MPPLKDDNDDMTPAEARKHLAETPRVVPTPEDLQNTKEDALDDPDKQDKEG